MHLLLDTGRGDSPAGSNRPREKGAKIKQTGMLSYRDQHLSCLFDYSAALMNQFIEGKGQAAKEAREWDAESDEKELSVKESVPVVTPQRGSMTYGAP